MTSSQIGKTHSSRQAIIEILKNGVVENLNGITTWPMLPSYKPQESYFYFDHEKSELGIAKFGKDSDK